MNAMATCHYCGHDADWSKGRLVCSDHVVLGDPRQPIRPIITVRIAPEGTYPYPEVDPG